MDIKEMATKAFLAKAKINTTSMPEDISFEPVPEEQRLQNVCNSMNKQQGNLKGYDCKECKNRGYVMSVKNGSIVTQMCKCREIRKTLNNIQRSGLSGAIKKYTFDNYKTTADWQKQIKKLALRYTTDNNRLWWYIGGQSGCGKTHICTAIANYFLQKGLPVKYMLWRDEVVRILANATNDLERRQLVEPIKTARVLYIDDFFKRKKGQPPTSGELNLAFEIINYRYINKHLITLISSELSVYEISLIDEAIGGRIYEMTAPNYMSTIPKSKDKNYRFRGITEEKI